MKQTFRVTGMSCAACQMHVEKAVRALPGVERADVNLLQNRLTVVYDEKKVSGAQIIAAVESAGYGAQEAGPQFSSPLAQTEAQSLQKRFWISVCFLIPLMIVAMAHVHGLAWLQVLLAVPILWLNRAFFTRGFTQLFKLTPTMDSLVALGATAAILQSVWALIARQPGGLYFESAAMIVTLVTLGKWLEARAKSKTTDAISGLVQLLPGRVSIRRNEEEKNIAVGEILAGDTLLVHTGERVGADGIISQGSATVDESFLTGESIPQEKKPGDAISAGTMLLSGYLEVTVQKTGNDTLLSQMISLVEQAAGSKASVARLADQVSRVFVPIVIGIAGVTFLVWWACGADIPFALSCAVCVLVISCPCALGLATPTAIMVGMGIGARRGILIKSADVLERARSINTVVLDKTGTVTTGQMQVAQVFPAQGVGKTELLEAAISLEKLSAHPLAIALVKKKFSRENFLLKSVSDFKEYPGLGVRGQQGGVVVSGGNLKAMQAWHIDVPHGEETLQVAAEKGQTVLFFAAGQKYLGAIGLSDTIKPTAKETISLLKKQGCRVILLTGDNAKTAAYVAAQTGIDTVKAGVLPGEKQTYLKLLQKQGNIVAMVGDGINDAPSLACADVGIAMGSGTDVAAASADMVLMRSDLREVATALELSAATLRNIKENLFWAFFYNILCIPLAAGVFYPVWGWKLHPMMAAAAMSFSSVCVVGNALRLNRFKPSFSDDKEEKNMRKVLEIKGMMCGHCSGHVSRALNAVPGVKATVDLASKTATVESASPVDDSVLIAAVQNAGYEVTAIH